MGKWADALHRELAEAPNLGADRTDESPLVFAEARRIRPDKTDKSSLLSALSVTPSGAFENSRGDCTTSTPVSTVEARVELFIFAGPADPGSDAEAIAERISIMAEANGWDDATALQEARWEVDRERCWRRFIQYASVILKAPARLWTAMLEEYQVCAARRFGANVAAGMRETMQIWVDTRVVPSERLTDLQSSRQALDS